MFLVCGSGFFASLSPTSSSVVQVQAFTPKPFAGGTTKRPLVLEPSVAIATGAGAGSASPPLSLGLLGRTLLSASRRTGSGAAKEGGVDAPDPVSTTLRVGKYEKAGTAGTVVIATEDSKVEEVGEESVLAAASEFKFELERSGHGRIQDVAPSSRSSDGTLMYTADEDFTTTTSTQLKDSDFVAVGRDEIEKDESLRMLSSELGVREIVGDRGDVGSAQIPLDLVLERTLDTVEDVSVHLKRVPYKWGFAPSFHKTRDGVDARETVVVLGSGWAAHAFLKVADCSKLRIVVVSPSNHFVFTPMLASAAVGTVEYRSMTEAVRSANPLIDNYVEGAATDVDVYNKVVKVRLNPLVECVTGELDSDDALCEPPPEIEIPYDRLVVSVGAKVADAGVPGADRCLRLKSCDDARNVRTALGECFEFASRPDVLGSHDLGKVAERKRRVTFLIVGGGPTGVELAGELSDFANDVTKPRVGAFAKLRDDVRVVLAHGGDEVLPQFDQGLREEAGESLRRRGIDLRLNTRVTKVEEDGVTLSTKVIDPSTGEFSHTERIEEKLPVGLTVWCAGTAPVPLVNRLLRQLPDGARCSMGRVKVDRYLRPPMPREDLVGSVYVLGDAAHFADGKQDKDGDGDGSLPQTAQVAGQQGAYIARLLSRGYDLTDPRAPVLPAEAAAVVVAVANNITNLDATSSEDEAAIHQWLRLRGLETAPPFRFFNLGLLAYLGGGEALSQVQIGDVPVFKWAGSVAFVLWRSVYLVKQVATKNRVLVTFDWLKSALFGRDVTRL